MSKQAQNEKRINIFDRFLWDRIWAVSDTQMLIDKIYGRFLNKVWQQKI